MDRASRGDYLNNERLKEELDRIIENRANIIEQFIQFWLAVHIPADQLDPKIFDRLVLVEKVEGTERKYWIEFKEEHTEPF